jgi:hypothetical protein
VYNNNYINIPLVLHGNNIDINHPRTPKTRAGVGNGSCPALTQTHLDLGSLSCYRVLVVLVLLPLPKNIPSNEPVLQRSAARNEQN